MLAAVLVIAWQQQAIHQLVGPKENKKLLFECCFNNFQNFIFKNILIKC